MKRSSGPRKTASVLSESLHQQLNKYAIVAGAAGVGALACVLPAEAKIVYTPANVSIAKFMSYNLDLNNDGIADFNLSVFYYSHSGARRFFFLHDSPLQKSNAVVVGGRGFARAFRPGITIGPKQVFGRGTNLGTSMATCILSTAYRHTSGPWINVKNRYLGLRFTINGKIHYGWARLTTGDCAPPGLSGTLTGYAYETIANRPILTGKTQGREESSSIDQPNPASLGTPAAGPATLGALAIGAPGLSIWRREESALEGN
jgi:hypothetical protein